MKLTSWYPPEIKPVHVGPFEVESISPRVTWRIYSWWNGREFLEVWPRPEYCRPNDHRNGYQARSWRGVKR